MQDSSLTPPHKVEYVVVKNRPRKWYLTLTALAIILAIAYIFAVYQSLRDVEQNYPDKPFQALGLKGSLKAKWFDNSLHFQFILTPLPNELERFRAVMQRDKASDFKFKIQLSDGEGYELCSIAPVIHRHIGLDGKPDSLEADEGLSTCMKDQFKKAIKWSISGHYPSISDSLEGASAPNDNQLASTRLTGSDFLTGEVETLNRGSFQVTKKAEFFTLGHWKPADDISLTCNNNQCVLTDLRTDESVHAMLK